MDLSVYSVTVVLIFFLVVGLFGVFVGTYERFRNSNSSHAHGLLLRGSGDVIISLAFLPLLRNGFLGPWPVLIAVLFVSAVKELLIIKTRRKNVPHQEPWSLTRERGEKRFVLVYVLAFGIGPLWGAVLIYIMALDWLAWFVSLLMPVAWALFGYLEGSRVWKQKEDEHLKSGHVGRNSA